jgi:hypothetical protein
VEGLVRERAPVGVREVDGELAAAVLAREADDDVAALAGRAGGERGSFDRLLLQDVERADLRVVPDDEVVRALAGAARALVKVLQAGNPGVAQRL